MLTAFSPDLCKAAFHEKAAKVEVPAGHVSVIIPVDPKSTTLSGKGKAYVLGGTGMHIPVAGLAQGSTVQAGVYQSTKSRT